MQQVNKTLTAAEIKALFTTPIELVPAPGAGRALIPFAAVAVLHFLTTAFAGANDMNISLGPVANGHTHQLLSSGSLDALADAAEEHLSLELAAAFGALAEFENQNLRAYVPVANPTLGLGSVTITVYYGTAKIT